MYAMLASGGAIDGGADRVRGSRSSLTRPSRPVAPMPYSETHPESALGYGRSTPGGMSLGPNDEAFGMQGIGGAIGYADPVAEVGFGYAMNQTYMEPGTDRRPRALTTALYEEITRQGG